MKRDLPLTPSFLDIPERRAPHPPVAALQGGMIWAMLDIMGTR